ncbi:MAG: curli biogenesis system outer membrane secretion channel CsgG [Candidatus Paceibacteria bacterium]|jgi:curli biogenesis system outer membrane secretion channel CsgG
MTTSNSTLAPFFLTGLALCSSGCASTPQQPEPMLPMPELSGPKRTVAVAKFDALDSFVVSHGDWDMGGGLSAMMTNELVQCGQFVVVERANLTHVLSEQELKDSGLVNQKTGPQLGAISGAQYLILASITEFGQAESGGGFSLGFAGIGGSNSNAAISPRTTKGHIGLDVRVVDATTSAVVASFHVREEITSSGFGFSFGQGPMAFGADTFEKTPIGEAARRAIARATRQFAGEVASEPWRGSVLATSGPQTSINAGSKSGVRVGDSFTVFRVLEELIDPSTGMQLGQRKQKLGALTVEEVEDSVSIAVWTPSVVGTLERGDLVISL